MRHLGSLLAGILIAPVAWILIALGQQKSASTIASWQQSSGFDTADLLLPAAYLLAAGILIGLIATLRISPVGALVTGVFYAGTFIALFVSPIRARNAVPETLSLLGRKVALRTPLDNGTLLLVGIALLVAVFSVARWRSWPAAAPVTAPPAAEAVELGGPVSSPADLPPEPAQTGQPVTHWPPSGPHPWTPAQARHSVGDQQPANDTANVGAPSAMDHPSADYPAASPPPAPQFTPPGPPPGQQYTPAGPPPGQQYTPAGPPPGQQYSPPGQQYAPPGPPAQQYPPPSSPSSLPPDGFPPPTSPPASSPAAEQPGPAAAPNRDAPKREAATREAATREAATREAATREAATAEETEAERPPPPPTSPWSAPPPRSGQS